MKRILSVPDNRSLIDSCIAAGALILLKKSGSENKPTSQSSVPTTSGLLVKRKVVDDMPQNKRQRIDGNKPVGGGSALSLRDEPHGILVMRNALKSKNNVALDSVESDAILDLINNRTIFDNPKWCSLAGKFFADVFHGKAAAHNRPFRRPEVIDFLLQDLLPTPKACTLQALHWIQAMKLPLTLDYLVNSPDIGNLYMTVGRSDSGISEQAALILDRLYRDAPDTMSEPRFSKFIPLLFTAKSERSITNIFCCLCAHQNLIHSSIEPYIPKIIKFVNDRKNVYLKPYAFIRAPELIKLFLTLAWNEKVPKTVSLNTDMAEILDYCFTEADFESKLTVGTFLNTLSETDKNAFLENAPAVKDFFSNLVF